MGVKLFYNYPQINFNGNQPESVENHKHLGLTLSYKLGWSTHINALLESIGSMSDIMKKLKYDFFSQCTTNLADDEWQSFNTNLGSKLFRNNIHVFCFCQT